MPRCDPLSLVTISILYKTLQLGLSFKRWKKTSKIRSENFSPRRAEGVTKPPSESTGSSNCTRGGSWVAGHQSKGGSRWLRYAAKRMGRENHQKGRV
jgi:hypothetical protein